MRIWYIMQFVFLYLWEVVCSTGQIVWLVVRPRIELNPCFVQVPLALESDFARLLFACLVSMTPGTLSVALDKERGLLLVHLLDTEDTTVSVAAIKDRIEAPLLKIFTR